MKIICKWLIIGLALAAFIFMCIPLYSFYVGV